MVKLNKINDDELERRRSLVDSAISSNRIEGVELSPEVISILEKFAQGILTLEEFNYYMDEVS